MFEKIIEKKWGGNFGRGKRRWKIFLGFLFLSLTVRGLPYLAPIRPVDIAQNEQAIAFTDRNGRPLGTLLTRDQEHTAVVPLEKISTHFINAIIAAEDGRYYEHGALDAVAIGRSLLEAMQAGEIISGASTITMQLARMLEPMPRSLPNKFWEIWLSWRLVAGMNKDEILAAYINRLPMGGNIYGVEAAARTYFGISADGLNLARSSLLAAIPNDPARLNPYYLWKPLKRRQKYVLDSMVKDGYISQAEADRAYAEKIQLLPPNQGIIAAPHFLFWLANQLPPDISSARTTIDRPLQQFVEAQVRQVVGAIATKNVNHAAAIAIDNHTGEVLAYVGSPNYFSPFGGRNDGVRALRQPGSTLKPFLYQLALEKKVIRPNTILPDVPTHYAIPGARLYSPVDYSETFLGPVRVRVALANSLNVPAVRVLEQVGVGTFLGRLQELGMGSLTESPEYYGLGLALGSGEVSLWELARAYFKMANYSQFFNYASNFASNSSNFVPQSLALKTTLFCNSQPATHSQEVKHSQGAINSQGGEYLTFVKGQPGGLRLCSRAFRRQAAGCAKLAASKSNYFSECFPATKVRCRLTPKGAATQTKPMRAGDCKSEMHLSNIRDIGDNYLNSAANNWALVTDMLADPYARAAAFGVSSVLDLPFAAAVKTGTSSDFRDTWTVGFTRDYTVATWVGNFSGDRMREVSGVMGAAPLWQRIMLHLHEGREPAPFSPPPDLVQKPICALTGWKPTPDCSSVVLEYFAPEDLSAYESEKEISLSAEYNEWLSRQNQPSLASRSLKIVFPQPGAYFLFDKTEPSTKLEFRLAAVPSEPVEWWLVGKEGKQKLSTTELSQQLFWSLSPGQWTLEVTSGKNSDRVSFEVALPEEKSTRRGFSVVGE